jgi:hypothetical protein
MLAVCIKHHQDLTICISYTGLDSRAIADVVGMDENPGSCIPGPLAGAVFRPVVHHDNLVGKIKRLHDPVDIGHDFPNGVCLLVCREDDTYPDFTTQLGLN